MDLYGTLGASCARREILTAMFQAGMTGARLNLSHSTLPECASLLEDEFWPAARQAGVEASLIVDLQGPELRVGRLEEPVPLRREAPPCWAPGASPSPGAWWRPPGPGTSSPWTNTRSSVRWREPLPTA